MAIKKNYKFRNERKLQRGKGKMNIKKKKSRREDYTNTLEDIKAMHQVCSSLDRMSPLLVCTATNSTCKCK
jgi:hypothetical protein